MSTNIAAAPALFDDRSTRDRLRDAAGTVLTETAKISLHKTARKAGVTAPLATY
jgi:hypothetical protein